MSKINILPAQVYNRIAAGEVVDRPYSVVKELVENSIDAGATEIEISVEGGGKQLIRVTDNGGGILREDLQAAFLPHATSKIAKADDLEHILTLGFRGEAVASISAVSKMTITSKVPEKNCYRLCSDGGKLGEIEEAAGDDGTDVRGNALFQYAGAPEISEIGKIGGDGYHQFCLALYSQPSGHRFPVLRQRQKSSAIVRRRGGRGDRRRVRRVHSEGLSQNFGGKTRG